MAGPALLGQHGSNLQGEQPLPALGTSRGYAGSQVPAGYEAARLELSTKTEHNANFSDAYGKPDATGFSIADRSDGVLFPRKADSRSCVRRRNPPAPLGNESVQRPSWPGLGSKPQDRLNWHRCMMKANRAPVAQLDRALASGARGRRFESCRAYHRLPQATWPPSAVPFRSAGDGSAVVLRRWAA